MCWYAGGPAPCPFGGKPVPMLALIYRKSAVWGRAGNHADLPLLLMRFYGEAQHSIFNGDVPIQNMLDSFYLAMVPWFRLHLLNIEGLSERRIRRQRFSKVRAIESQLIGKRRATASRWTARK
jgi:hypothetical protein